MRVHVNNQGRVLPCRAKHACRFGASFENVGEAESVLDRYHEAVGAEPRITGDLQAKESVHVLYERLRRQDVSPAEREEVCRAMDATFSGLEVPVDALTARR